MTSKQDHSVSFSDGGGGEKSGLGEIGPDASLHGVCSVPGKSEPGVEYLLREDELGYVVEVDDSCSLV